MTSWLVGWLVEVLRGYSHLENQRRRIDRASHLLPSGPTPRQRPRRRQVQVRLSDNQITDLVAAYRDGTKINDLAKSFAINRTTVLAHLKRAKVPQRRGRVERSVEAAALLYEDGWSLVRIGDHMGVNPSTVWTALRRHGVQMRDTHGRTPARQR
jgi:DNA-directed RNA polymerase specialized sigma24 family protein